MAKVTHGKAAGGTGLTSKLVITHRGALLAKYKAAGYSRIKKALEAMAAADRQRGIVSKFALLDSYVADAGPGTTSAYAGHVKKAIDALYKKFGKPDYLLLLGGPDVIAHQRLRNPWAGEADEEPVVPSDLPYACDQAYSLDAAKFLGPTRVVGRLPDIPGSTDVSYLVQLIEQASRAKALKGRKYFGLSAEVWKGASEENLRQAFGISNPLLYCSPSLGPTWAKTYLNRPLHLINCHGNPEYWIFSGQPGSGEDDYPPAIDTDALKGRVMKDAVIAAECCYGAELYEPQGTLVPKGMALTYLEEGAMGFLGSSTIAYGGLKAGDVSCADVVCSAFLNKLMAGATTGRALLEARQALVSGAMTLDNYQLKTLAQFMLLGDPAYRAFPAKAGPTAKTKTPANHAAHRRTLAKAGGILRRSAAAATKQVAANVSGRTALAGSATPGQGGSRMLVFEVPGSKSKPEAILVVLKDGYPNLKGARSGKRTQLRVPEKPVKSRVAVVARVVDGRVVSAKTITTR